MNPLTAAVRDLRGALCRPCCAESSWRWSSPSLRRCWRLKNNLGRLCRKRHLHPKPGRQRWRRPLSRRLRRQFPKTLNVDGSPLIGL